MQMNHGRVGSGNGKRRQRALYRKKHERKPACYERCLLEDAVNINMAGIMKKKEGMKTKDYTQKQRRIMK